MNAARRLRFVALALLLSIIAILAPGTARTAFADEGYRYIEGQAIVGVLERDGLSIQSELPYTFEELMDVSASAAGVQGVSGGGISVQGDERVVLELVTSPTLTTGELISELERDPRILFAEPNEIITFPGPSDLEDNLMLPSSSDETPATMSDLTGLQWGMWGEASFRNPDSLDNPSVNSPGFGPDGRRGENMDSEVIVAVLDMGVDYENPDLADVVYHFNKSEQQLLRCGEWGYNSMGDSIDGVPVPLTKGMDHGTHCAGIVGASWDGHGISGVASNVQIVAIQIGIAGRATSLADSLRGFEFVKRANDFGINIQITSSSWGIHRSTLSLDAAVRELGENYGIVSVFSAGNNSVDDALSEVNVSQFVDNPYAIVVAATEPNDELASYSSFGETTVDIAAPGSMILSTVPWASASFLPDAIRDDGIYFEGFEGGDSDLTASVTYYPQPAPEDDDMYGWGDEGVAEQEEVSVDAEGGVVSTEAEEELEAVPEEELAAVSEEADNLTDPASEDTVLNSQGEEDVDETLTTMADEEEGEDQAGVTVSGEVSGALMFYGNSSLYFPIDDPRPGSAFPIHIDIDLGSERMQQLAEQDELYFGFSFLVDGVPMMSSPEITTNITGDAVLPAMDGGALNFDSAWKTVSYDLTKNGPITPSEDGHLVIDVDLMVYGTVRGIYLDSFGIGNKLAPYAFMDGTSMAAPLVAGGAAVIASKSGAEGAELASLVRAHVRIPDAGALPVRTGGVLDLSASVSDALSPVIDSAEAKDTSVTISGLGFGGNPGTVTLSKYVVGRDLEPIGATISSWGEGEIVCTTDESFSGILHVQVTNESGLTDTALLFISKGEEVYEQDLPFDADTGAPFVSEAPGDLETKGPLVGLGCKLYYLPSHQFIEGAPAHKRMLIFDLKTNSWSQGPELPEWLSGPSACIYDGKLIVEGSEMFLNELGVWSDENPSGEEAEERVYVFDPTTSSWSRASNEGMKLGQTLFNDAGALKLIGGYTSETDDQGMKVDITYPLMSYSLDSGVTAELLSDIPLACFNPSVAAQNDTILVYNQMTGRVMRIRGGQAEYLDRCGLNLLLGSDSELFGEAGYYETDPYVCRGTVSPVKGGFIFVGPPSKDGSSDTFFLADDADEFVPYSMRASEARIFSQTSIAYRGRLFAIASSRVEPEKRIFRATALETVEYPGDIPCEQDEPVEPVEPVTPDEKPPSTLPKTSDVMRNAFIPFAAGILALAASRLVGEGKDDE